MMKLFYAIFLNNSVFMGALISIISSSITLVLQAFIVNFFKERGKTNIYYQTVYDRFTSEPWGFHGSNTDEYFDVPLWIEIHNSKGTRQIIRNLNLSLYLAGKFISKTKQINYHEKTPYGDNGSYSFLIEAGEIKRFNLYFVLKGGDIDFMDFDEVRLSYFDTNDRYKEYKIFDIDNPWQLSNHKISDDWQKLN
ncbi:hypothetical protein [Streptococcus salivarius]|nr:hypothetical protein [Streptococcus salivarius]